MLITSDTKIFKPVYKPELTTKLEQVLTNLNLKMTSNKRRWANAVMNYNLTSRQAFEHRFVAYPSEDGRQTSDGRENDDITGEEEKGSYVCIPIVKAKRDQYRFEFQDREFFCDVKSYAYENAKYLVQGILNESFETSSFRKALDSAFCDALDKQVGYLRPRLYDVKQNLNDVLINQEGKKETRYNRNQPVKKGLVIEHVDTENVFVDPEAKNPKEIIISTQYTDLELIYLFPQLFDFIDLQIYGEAEIVKQKNEVEKEAKNNKIKPFWLHNWKIGEQFTEWYFKPEMLLDFTRGYQFNSFGSNYKLVGPTDPSSADFTQNGFGLRGNIEYFNNLWDGLYFGDYYNTLGESWARRNRLFRLNEYYNIAQNRYIMWIDSYVLYDGPMFEPYKELPIATIYFDHNQSNGWFGKSVNDHLHLLQTEANISANLSKQALEMSSVNIVEVDVSRLMQENKPIKAQSLTFVPIRNLDSDQRPAINQIGFQNQALALYPEQEKKWFNLAEQLMPSTEPIFNQLPKEERDQTIRARSMRPNFFLKYNADQLTDLAYKVFLARLKEMEMAKNSEFIITLSQSRRVGIVVRETENDIIIAKKQVTDILRFQRQQAVLNAQQQLLQDPAFQQQLQRFQLQKQAEFQQLLQNPDVNKTLSSEPKKKNSLLTSQQQLITQEISNYIQQSAEQLVPPAVDENIYLNLEQLGNLQKAQKEFNFSFRKTKDEIQRDITEFLGVISQVPLTAQAINYKTFADTLAIHYGFNPDIIMQDVPPPNELVGLQNSRFTNYIDWQTNFPYGEALAKKVYNIKENDVKFDQNSVSLQAQTAIKQMETAFEAELVNVKSAGQAKNKVIGQTVKAEVDKRMKEQERKNIAINATQDLQENN